MHQARRSITLDEKEIIKEILSVYDEIEIIDEDDDIIFFKLKEKEYGLWLFSQSDRTNSPIVLVKNDAIYSYPHFLTLDIPLDKDKKDKYRLICLRESDSIIKFLQSYEEKIVDTIERLLHLLSLTPLEIEKEFQKEFLYYWNDIAKNTTPIKLYIGKDRVFQKMNAYINNLNSELRIVANGIKLNDKEKEQDGKKLWEFQPEIPFYYIPIDDNRRIIPPMRDNVWTQANIMQIIKGKRFGSISHEVFEKIKQEKIKSKKAGLVFEMNVDGNRINFCCLIVFKDAKKETLLYKLENAITEIKIVKSKRMDFCFLCNQIGNDTSIIAKKVLLIGAGSLGSYIANELVKAGICNLTIYDGDKLEDENTLRHTLKGFWVGIPKANALKYELESIHPEVNINAVNKDIDKSSLMHDINSYDMIIFTVGSSDVQLDLNRILSENHFNKSVIFTWLEAGGIYSHILVVNYSKKGCFECLYTDDSGELINNKVNQLSDEQIDTKIIRNGCGATRVAYGTEILLRTTSVVLNTIRKVFNGELNNNTLINIEPTSVNNVGNTFVERMCHCCGNRDSQ
jgi:molybdopterin-synthase adenylyltransferase